LEFGPARNITDFSEVFQMEAEAGLEIPPEVEAEILRTTSDTFRM
jgi:hypothetical protein